MRVHVLAVSCAALMACAPPAAQKEAAKPTAPAPGAMSDGPPAANAPEGWTVTGDDPMTLAFAQGDLEFAVACALGTKDLRIRFAPAWEIPCGVTPDAGAVKVVIGAKTFDAQADAASLKENAFRPVYVLAANADTVRAFMTANTLGLRLQTGEQERMSDADATGAFDRFAASCAQINGLK